MQIDALITGPLPASLRESLLLVIDAREARLRWVVRLLAFAHYRAHAALTPFEAYSWYREHLVEPQAMLLGQVSQQERLFVALVWQRISRQRGQAIPIISLAAYLSETASRGTLSFSPRSGGCYALLEVLWRVVARHG